MIKEKLKERYDAKPKEGYETFQPDHIESSKEIGTSIRPVPYHKGNIDIRDGGSSYLIIGKPRAIIEALVNDKETTFSATRIEEAFDKNGLYIPQKIADTDSSIKISINKIFEKKELLDVFKESLLDIVAGSVISTTIGIESLTSALTDIGLGFPGIYEGQLNPAKGAEAALTSYGVGTVKEGLEILINKLKDHKKNPSNEIPVLGSKNNHKEKIHKLVNQLINLMSDTYIVRIDSVDHRLKNTYDFFKPVLSKNEIAKGVAEHFGIIIPNDNSQDTSQRSIKNHNNFNKTKDTSTAVKNRKM